MLISGRRQERKEQAQSRSLLRVASARSLQEGMLMRLGGRGAQDRDQCSQTS